VILTKAGLIKANFKEKDSLFLQTAINTREDIWMVNTMDTVNSLGKTVIAIEENIMKAKDMDLEC